MTTFVSASSAVSVESGCRSCRGFGTCRAVVGGVGTRAVEASARAVSVISAHGGGMEGVECWKPDLYVAAVGSGRADRVHCIASRNAYTVFGVFWVGLVAAKVGVGGGGT